MAAEAEEHPQAGWLRRRWPFGSSQPAVTDSHDDDSFVETRNSATAEGLTQSQVQATPNPPRTRAVCLQHLDDNSNGTGQLVPLAEAAKKNLIWELNQVRYPLTDLVKTPPPEDVRALREGVRRGIFQGAIVRPPYAKYHPVSAAILLTDRITRERFAYHTDYIEEEPCTLPDEEKFERQMYIVFLNGEDLPSYHFWQDPEDPDPTRGLCEGRAQLLLLGRLVRQSINHFQRLERCLESDMPNEHKSRFAEDTFVHVSEILGRLKLPMTRDLSKKVHAMSQQFLDVFMPISEDWERGDGGDEEDGSAGNEEDASEEDGEDASEEDGEDGPEDMDDGSEEHGEDGPEEDGEDEPEDSEDGSEEEDKNVSEEENEKDEDEANEISSLFETSPSPFERPRPHGQWAEDDGKNVYPVGVSHDDDLEGEEEEEATRIPPTSKKEASPQNSKKRGRPRKSPPVDRTYNGENDLPLSPSEKSPVLPRPPKRRPADHPDASFQPQKKIKRSSPSPQPKKNPSDALKRGLTRSGAKFSLAANVEHS